MTSPTSPDHGVALTERAIAAVEADPHRLVLGHLEAAGPWVGVTRTPFPAELLATAAFPGGRPLPPSLRRWLGYDTGLLRRFGWFGATTWYAEPAGAAGADRGFELTPRPLGELARAEFGDGWGSVYDALSDRFDECFLLPGGSDSRRVLATGEPDAFGEYPVFALDIDDLPCIELMYPGFDVYLADTAGVISRRGSGYSALSEDPRYAARMHTHARNAFGGAMAEECLDLPS
ncbi:hypothetical protein AB0D08_29845 [Kitasatospora sp. NPDC048540]|uniref:hypothetical protein n=1 Tax=Kitasatospora sp. NPDC048540 TaxID=3155634 RepID=UPI0034030603